MEKTIETELKIIKPIILESTYTKFLTEGLADCVEQIQICEIENVQEDNDIQLVFNSVWFSINNFWLIIMKINIYRQMMTQ